MKQWHYMSSLHQGTPKPLNFLWEFKLRDKQKGSKEIGRSPIAWRKYDVGASDWSFDSNHNALWADAHKRIQELLYCLLTSEQHISHFSKQLWYPHWENIQCQRPVAFFIDNKFKLHRHLWKVKSSQPTQLEWKTLLCLTIAWKQKTLTVHLMRKIHPDFHAKSALKVVNSEGITD